MISELKAKKQYSRFHVVTIRNVLEVHSSKPIQLDFFFKLESYQHLNTKKY